MISANMKEILLYSLSEEHELYPEEYSPRSIKALLKRGMLIGEEDDYEITKKGIQGLGLPSKIRAKRPKTIIKKIMNILCDSEIEFFAAKDLPAIAADEDHYHDRTLWHNFDDVLFAMQYWGDDLELIMAQIACDYAKKQGHLIYAERVRHLLLFYNEE